MSLPTKRISLNQRENSALRTGLNRIVNEFEMIRCSGRRAPDMVDSRLRETLQPRFLAPGTEESILSLRDRLVSVADKKHAKLRLTVIDFAILAFAARVAGRHCAASVPPGFEAKLERHRKRAKRRAMTVLGKETYDEAARQWACSARWIRFNLLPSPECRWDFTPRRLYREQFQQMYALAEAVIAERCTEPPSEKELRHVLELIMREIRRKRHPEVTVRELQQDESKTKNFLFKLISKKMPDLKLKFEFRSLDVQQAERAEPLRAAMVVNGSGSTSGNRDGLRFLKEAMLYKVARFLRDNLNQALWNEVAALAAAIAKNSTTLKPNQLVPETLLLNEVMVASRPPWKEPYQDVKEILEYDAAWLLHFFMQGGTTPEEGVELLKRAIELAVQMGDAPRSVYSPRYIPDEGPVDSRTFHPVLH